MSTGNYAGRKSQILAVCGGILLFGLLLFAGSLVFNRGGDVRYAKMDIGTATIYEKRDIQKAMDTAVDYFDKHFEGCTLQVIAYNEKYSNENVCASWAKQYNAEEAIVFISEFDVDKNGGDGSFNPNSTYTKWQWILTRNTGEDWKLQTWGY